MKDIRLYKNDILLILIILFTAFVIMVFNIIINNSSNKIYAEITFDGQIIKTIDINENKLIYLEDMPKVAFEVRDGSIGFVQSDCPDQVCVHNGFLNRPGQLSVCLPNKLTLMIVGYNDDIDIFTN